jgi:hypothetical protein
MYASCWSQTQTCKKVIAAGIQQCLRESQLRFRNSQDLRIRRTRGHSFQTNQLFSVICKWLPHCFNKLQRALEANMLRIQRPRTKRKEFSFVVLAREVEMTYEVHGQAAAEWAPFPERTDVHWEAANLQVWSAREGTAEQQELVYEVSWIKELGTWRRFLTSRRKVRSERQEVPC